MHVLRDLLATTWRALQTLTVGAAIAAGLVAVTLAVCAFVLRRVAKRGRPADARALATTVGAMLVTPIQWLHDTCLRCREWLAARRAGAGTAVFGERWAPWVVIAAVVASVIWLITVVALLGLDREGFTELGYSAAQATRLAVLLVAAATVIGLLLTDVLGLTQITPVHRTRPAIRAAFGIALLVVFLLVNVQMNVRLGEARAEQVRNAELLEASTLAALAADDPELQGVADQMRAEAEGRYRTNSQLDPRLGMVAATLEAATSWGPLTLVVLLVTFVAFLCGAALRFLGALAGLAWRLLTGAVQIMERTVAMADPYGSDTDATGAADPAPAAPGPAAGAPNGTRRPDPAPDDVEALADLWAAQPAAPEEPAVEATSRSPFPPAF